MKDATAKTIAATYDYTDAEGRLLYQVVRFSPKSFRQRRPDGQGGWAWNLKGIEPVPYRLPEVLKATEVFIAEGEKDVAALEGLDLVATCNSGGAGKWRNEFARFFKGRTVYIIPDNDAPGREHAEQVARSLSNVARTVKVINLPDLTEKGDVSDWLKGKDPAKARAELQSLCEKTSAWTPAQGETMPSIVDCVSLMEMDLKEPSFLVPGMVVEGVSLIVGNPKVGKSFFLTQLGLAVAQGREFLTRPTGKTGVVYLALEDSLVRMRNRLADLLQGAQPPANFHIVTQWPRLDEGGAEALEKIIQEKDVGLVIVDVLEGVRPLRKAGSSVYAQDYEALQALRQIAQKHGTAFLVSHHTRKAEAEDFVSLASGSHGLTGAVDAILLLKRKRTSHEATLHITGRDVEEETLCLEFDPLEGASWRVAEGEEWSLSPEQKNIMAVLKKTGEPLAPRQIAERLGARERVNSITILLRKLRSKGLVSQPRYGLYVVKGGRGVVNSVKSVKSRPSKRGETLNTIYGLNKGIDTPSPSSSTSSRKEGTLNKINGLNRGEDTSSSVTARTTMAERIRERALRRGEVEEALKRLS